MVGISYEVYQEILVENLNMHSEVCPSALDTRSKAACLDVCLEFREMAKDDPTFSSRVVTGDEI